MFPSIVDIPSIVDSVDIVDTADIVHIVDTLDNVKSVNSVDLFSECLGGPRDFDVFRGSWTFSSFFYCFLSIENHCFLLQNQENQ